MSTRPVAPPRPAPPRPARARGRGRRGRRRRRARALRDRPRALGRLRSGTTGLARREHPRRRRVLRRPAHRAGRRPGHQGRRVRRRGRRRLGARQRRDHAVRRAPRRARSATASSDRGIEWVATGSPYAVGPGRVRTKERRPLPRLHAVLPRLARARLGRARDRAPRRTPGPGRRRRPRAPRGSTARSTECPVDLPTAGEDAALRRWRAFRDEHLGDYADGRDRPDLRGTSQLSPYLKVGAIHPRTILADLAGDRSRAPQVFTDELAWREFYADVLHDEPRLGLARPAARARAR